MRNLRVTRRTPLVEVSFTPEQWQLYVQPGEDADYAAEKLNRTLEAAISRGYDRKDTERLMGEEMSKLASFGAYDTEPLAFLDDVLDEIYADERKHDGFVPLWDER